MIKLSIICPFDYKSVLKFKSGQIEIRKKKKKNSHIEKCCLVFFYLFFSNHLGQKRVKDNVEKRNFFKQL